MKHKFYYLCCLILVILDQLSKQIVSTNFYLGESREITPFFSWTYLQNSGAAFSFLADGGDTSRYILLGISVVASLGLVVWIQLTSPLLRQRLLGQSIFLAGALGNLIDRALFAHVIDFIDLHYAGFYWPVFNLADSFIFVGVVILLLESRQSKT